MRQRKPPKTISSSSWASHLFSMEQLFCFLLNKNTISFSGMVHSVNCCCTITNHMNNKTICICGKTCPWSRSTVTSDSRQNHQVRFPCGPTAQELRFLLLSLGYQSLKSAAHALAVVSANGTPFLTPRCRTAKRRFSTSHVLTARGQRNDILLCVWGAVLWGSARDFLSGLAFQQDIWVSFCTEREKKADAAAGPHWQRSVFEQLQIPTAEMKWNFQLHFGVTPLCHRQVHYPVTASPPDGQRRTKAMSEALCSTKAVLINHKVGRTFLETRNSNDQMCNQVRGKHTIMTVALRSMVLDSNLMDQHTSIFTCKFETVHSNSVRTHIRQWQLAHLGRSRRSATASTRAKNKKR